MDIQLRDLTVELGSGETTVRPLQGFDLDVPSGSLGLLVGPSGCGKTTLLSVLAGLLTPQSGTVRFGDRQLGHSRADLLAHRRSTVGVVFQAFNLVPSLTALENVAAPLLAAGMRPKLATEQAGALLDQVALADRRNHKPSEMSGGQQQRVAIARALAHDPPVLLADEPTAHLDPRQVDGILVLLRTLAGTGRTVLISTHDDRLRPLADLVIDLGVEGLAELPPPEVHLDYDEVLFAEGTRGHLIYVIEQGMVEVSRGTGAAREVLAHLGPGDHVGDMGALFQRARSATVTAVEPSLLRSYSPVQFAALVGAERLDGLQLDGVRPKRRLAKRAPRPAAKAAPKRRAAR